FPAVRRAPAFCAWMGVGIALQDPGVRLADEARWQRPGSGHATPVRLEAHVAADTRRRRWGHQPDYFSGSQADAQRTSGRVSRWRLPRRAATWECDRTGESGGIL